ncbi:MAG: hypothetical protein KJZ64_08870, partial [Sphingomonadaceae bacterium]|nr:hypothetical protein [Sphingomonadaceae bacterium]
PSREREGALCTPTRATARQATSAVAHIAPEPDADDPLLAFAPYLHAAPRRNSITPDKQRAFIAHLAATGIVAQAARHIGKSLEALYKLRHQPGAEGFSAAWDAALERGVQRLEDSALARAIEGTPVWKTDRDGGIITYGMQHNEALVMFFLRNRRPERYSEHIRPGHPVYERIRAEVLAGVGRASGWGAHARADSRECALSRHFAGRLGQAGAGGLPQEPDGPDGPQLPPPDAP